MSVSNEDENPLDIYLKSLFHEHVEFHINDKEVDMIKTGIEWMVKVIVQAIEKETWQLRKDLSTEFFDRYPGHEFICSGNSTGGNIIKAGSFYEGTKNGYPDEFDFIYILSTFKAARIQTTDESSYWRQKYFILSEFHDVIRDIITPLMIPNFYFTTDNGAFLAFDGYDRHEGPASKFKFAYWNEFYDKTYIYVDVVPAFKIIDFNIHLRMRDECFIKDFVQEVKATGSYLITEEVSFTPTEMFFVRTILSNKHRNAYRIVKYLLNGNRNGGILHSYTHSTGITSYVIKVAMVNHHCICKNPKEKVSNCVISVVELLQKLCSHFPESNGRGLIRKLNGGSFNFRINDIIITSVLIRKLLMKLELMKVLDLPLNIKPISTLLVYDIEARQSTGARRSIRSRTSSNKTSKSRKTATVFLENYINYPPGDDSSIASSAFNWEDDLTSVAFHALVTDRVDAISLPASMRRFYMPKVPSNLNSTPKMSVLDSKFFQKPEHDEFSLSSSEAYVGSSRPDYDTLSLGGHSYVAEVIEEENGFQIIVKQISSKPKSNKFCCLIM